MIIRSEKDKIENDCSHIQNQPNIRHITRRINDLNEKLDSSLNLLEPRENSYIVYERGSSKTAIQNAIKSVSSFGSLLVSKTFPSLCVAEVQQLMINTKSNVLLTAVDYDGHYRVTGGDPVEAVLNYYGDNDTSKMVPVTVKDNTNGSYSVTFTPSYPGRYCLQISIFKRPIKNSPLCLEVSPHINPVWQYSRSTSSSSEDSKTCSLLQPVRVNVDSAGHIYILDTGHNRVKVLTHDGRLIRQFSGKSMMHHSTVGLALLSSGGFLTLNWRLKMVTEWSNEGREVKTFSFSEFVEPIDLAVDKGGNIFVLDTGATKIFMFDANAKPLLSFPVASSSLDNGHLKGGTIQATAMCIGLQNEIIVAGSDIRFFDASGQLLRNHLIDIEHSPPPLVGGIVVDDEGYVLATITGKKLCYVLVMNHDGKVVNHIDSADSRLHRPTGICVTANSHCIVADLGNNCIKMYRYK
ncbi:unnamed protein product [Soboliphyme baturini]|uniref:Tripartite motif-containing protein 2 n=1 Tax=Soboliphyme baturini TaxID=241478 RepID=A0A183I9H7_9BILA|nr:unnamed protein product [Soboliphyme baturini]